jgi:hypothetical protein
VLGEEVFADYTDDADFCEEAGGEGEVRGSAAEHALALAAGGFEGVECYGTYYEDGQACSLLSVCCGVAVCGMRGSLHFAALRSR